MLWEPTASFLHPKLLTGVVTGGVCCTFATSHFTNRATEAGKKLKITFTEKIFLPKKYYLINFNTQVSTSLLLSK